MAEPVVTHDQFLAAVQNLLKERERSGGVKTLGGARDEKREGRWAKKKREKTGKSEASRASDAAE